MALVTENGDFDLRAIMAEAHRLYRTCINASLTFANVLRVAWARGARAARDQRLAELAAFQRLAWAA